MNRITVSDELVQQLLAARSLVEICDPNGNVIGSFCPTADRTDYEFVVPPISDEEFEQRMSQQPGRKLRDILKDLEKLP